jgi:isopentenyl diphosphate isomerase/L-lactate dehydrogenase-like FMN-dependent dehydrogenase
MSDLNAPAADAPVARAAASPGMERQLDLYLRGLSGQTPDLPVAPEAMRAAARAALAPEAWSYLDGGAGTGDTMDANRAAFRRRRLVPRMLRGADDRDLRVTLFGQTFRAPLLFAPIGVGGILHDEAELAVARAAHALDLPLVLSTAASRTLEDVAEALGDTPRWFQLYWGKNDDVTASLVGRAEAAGYTALVVTLDTTILAWRDRDLDLGYLPFLHGDGLANYFADPAFRAALDEPPEDNPTQAILYFASIFSNPGLTWDDLAWLRRQTRLPIILKGILHPDDARRATNHGMDGVVVSNHGGRQVDGAVAALDALPRVAEAAGERLTVLFDSGIRRGGDVLKALALGAEAVLVGRPWAYGLAAGGEDGVRHVMHNLLAETDLALGLTGHATVADLGPDALAE